MNNYCKQRISTPGAVWKGKILAGVTGIVELCGKIDSPGAILFKDRPKIKAAFIDGYFVKRYNLPGFLTRLRRRFKPSRPSYALAGAVALKSLQIETPEVVAALVEEKGLALRREYLVTRALAADGMQFSEICKKDPENAWQLLLDKVTVPLCRMHDSGWLHGDLSLRNIYLLPGAAEAGFIDLDGMRHRGCSLSSRHRAAEAARLVSSFMHYTGDISAVEELTAGLLERYNAVSTVKLTPAMVIKSMGSMLERVKKVVENERKI